MSSLKAGLDIEMPGSACNWLLDMILPTDFALLSQPASCTHMTPSAVSDGIDSGEISEADLDDSVSRILKALFAIGEFDAPNTNTPDSAVSSSQHHSVAAQVAAAGTVLLKNRDSGGRPLLPIVIPPVDRDHPGEVLSIAVIGHEALGMTTGGGGSGGVTESNSTSPLNGIRVRMGLAETINPWGGAAEQNGAAEGDCTPDGRMCVRYQDVVQDSDIEKAVQLALSSTHVLIFVATTSQEGMDRDNLTLSSSCQTVKRGQYGLPVCANGQGRGDRGLPDQDAMIAAVVRQSGDHTAVIAVTPGALLMPWAVEGQTPEGLPLGAAAVLTPFMPGQAYGLAIASILFGDTNPTGRLPVTFPASETQQTISVSQYPGLRNGDPATPMPRPCTGPLLGPFPSCPVDGVVTYSERLEVGYRWFDAHAEAPAFCFGHGLSYSTFSYSTLRLSPLPPTSRAAPDGDFSGLTVSFTVTNSGAVRV